jgi:hypothetical protein
MKLAESKNTWITRARFWRCGDLQGKLRHFSAVFQFRCIHQHYILGRVIQFLRARLR